ncbi:urease accessory UreF family protein [Kribbella jejuensis]|uniref:urease accessory UreF family protein n=1 Tax=Kribbella jejuensis TaxID=236068 RepID=UPI001EE2E959|nr:urease accessory UreF family protein [Kribbella jejuensis]
MEHVAEYARDRLHTVTRVEAAVAVVTRHLILHPDAGVQVGLWGVEGAWAARTPSEVLRGVSRRQGRLLLRLAGRVWPEVVEYLPVDGEVPRAIVVGVVAAVNGLSAEQVARVVAYEDAQTVVSASLKLLPVDPADAAGWLAGLHDDIERLVKDVAPLTEPSAIPADGAPLIDVFAHQHATERMRLFNA